MTHLGGQTVGGEVDGLNAGGVGLGGGVTDNDLLATSPNDSTAQRRGVSHSLSEQEKSKLRLLAIFLLSV